MRQNTVGMGKTETRGATVSSQSNCVDGDTLAAICNSCQYKVYTNADSWRFVVESNHQWCELYWSWNHLCTVFFGVTAVNTILKDSNHRTINAVISTRIRHCECNSFLLSRRFPNGITLSNFPLCVPDTASLNPFQIKAEIDKMCLLCSQLLPSGQLHYRLCH